MKIEVDIPDGATVGTPVTGTVTAIGTTNPPPTNPPPTNPPPTNPPPAGGDQPGPQGNLLPVTNLGTLAPYSGNHTFVPSSAFITTVQLTGNARNVGFSSPPPTQQGCWAALGTVPGGSDVIGWTPGPDNANLSMYPAAGGGCWLSMVLDPAHPPPSTSFYSAN